MLTLDPFLDRIRPLLADHSQPVYLVGGAVRDALLGRANHDIDLIVATGAIELTFDLARRLGLPAYRLDEERDVGRILVPGGDTTFDIARFRGDALADDLRARDFTVNALALPVATRTADAVIDHHGGLVDLAAGRLRVIHDNSIADDPVRALRAARFVVQLGFALTEETAAAMRAAGPLLAGRVSPERIRDELSRLLLTTAPDRGVALLRDYGLLGHTLPEVAAMTGVAQTAPHHEDVLPHTLSVLRYLTLVEQVIDGETLAAGWAAAVDERLTPYRSNLIGHLDTTLDGGFGGRLLLRWSALLHDSGKPPTQTIDETGRIRFLGHDETGARLATTILNRLRFSGEAVRRVRDTVAGHMRPLHLANDGRPPARRAVYRYYRALHAAGIDVALLSLADHLATYDGPGPDDSWAALLAAVGTLLDTYFTGYEETVAPPRLLNGLEVMALLGIEPGRALGRLLADLEEAQAAGEVTTREAAVAFLRRAAEGSSAD